MSRPVRLGVIGLGMVAGTHARALADLAPDVEVVAAFSRDPGRRAAAAEAYGWAVVEDIGEILQNPSIDAVLVLTPPNARADIVSAAARANKAILCEKPLERTLLAAEDLVHMAEDAGVPLGVVLQSRFRPAGQALRKLAAEGTLGKLAIVQMSVAWWRPQTYYDEPGRGTLERDGGGVLITQAIHALDLMLWALGPIASVQAIAGTSRLHRLEGEDFVGAGLCFANGALGVLTATTAAFPGSPERIVATFEHGTATLEGSLLTIQHMDGRTDVVGASAGSGGGADPMAFSHEAHRALIADFCDAVRNKRAPAVSGRDALPVHALIEALLRSSREQRKVVLGA